MTDHITSAAYRELVGATDGPAEMDAATYRRLIGNPVSANDLVPRRHSSEADTEPPAKQAFRIALHILCPDAVEEYAFLPDRKYRADWALVDLKIVIEYDGLADHATQRGMWKDSEKGNLAQLDGWLFLRVNAASINDGRAVAWVERAIAVRNEGRQAA
jgi:hypothetical protein